MESAPDTFSTNGTNGIINGTNINILPTTIITSLHKHQKWLIDKKRYIINVLLITALLLILFGIFMVIGRHKKNTPAKVSELEKIGNVENGSGNDKYSNISSLQQIGYNKQSLQK
ncbi:hypothetical protein WUBG_12630, partial [Wuchereria bancrofti]